jgi:hypothetical protein
LKEAKAWRGGPHVDPAADPYRGAAAKGAHKHLLVLKILERAKGFEPSTPTLARLCSTPELHPRPRAVHAANARRAQGGARGGGESAR